MLLDQFNTKQELDHLLASLTKFKLDLFNYTSEQLEQKLYDEYDVVFVNTLKELLKNNSLSINDDNKLQIESLLDQVEKEAAEVEVLKITLAFTPTERFLAELQNWISKHVGQNVLLDLLVREEIIGGAEIVYKGLYKDMTISNKLENYEFKLS